MANYTSIYASGQAVDQALQRGEEAWTKINSGEVGGGKIEMLYNGTNITVDGAVVNFKQIVDYLTVDNKFTYLLYNNMAYLTTKIDTTSSLKQVVFESSHVDGGMGKIFTITVNSSDGVTIASINHTHVANENYSNKVSTIAENDKKSTVHYPSNKAVTDITDGLKEDLSELSDELNSYIKKPVNIWNESSEFNVIGKYYNGSGVETSGATDSYRHTYMIPVKSGDVVRFIKFKSFKALSGGAGHFGACFKSDGSVLQGIKYANVTDDFPSIDNNTTTISYTVPSEGAFVSINYIVSSSIPAYTTMITINNPYPSEYTPYVQGYELSDDIKIKKSQIIDIDSLTVQASNVTGLSNEVSKIVNEKELLWTRLLGNVLFIGDSLTKGAYYLWDSAQNKFVNQGSNKNSYPFFFSKETGLDYVNEGVSGSSPSSRWAYFSTFDFTQYESFIIWWGVNGGLADTIGQGLGDNTDNYCKVIDRIILQVPSAKIFLGNVYTASGEADRATTNNTIAKIAERYPNNIIGVVDNYSDGIFWAKGADTSHIIPNIHPQKPDGTMNIHFNTLGNIYLAHHWVSAISDMINSDKTKMERFVPLVD